MEAVKRLKNLVTAVAFQGDATLCKSTTHTLNQFAKGALKSGETCYTEKLFTHILYAIISSICITVLVVLSYNYQKKTHACLIYSLAKPIIKALDVDNTLFSFVMQEKNNVIPPQ